MEACLSHGLKRRTLVLFKASSTTALIHKVGKSFEPALQVSKKVQEIEAQDPTRLVNHLTRSFDYNNLVVDCGWLTNQLRGGWGCCRINIR